MNAPEIKSTGSKISPFAQIFSSGKSCARTHESILKGQDFLRANFDSPSRVILVMLNALFSDKIGMK